MRLAVSMFESCSSIGRSGGADAPMDTRIRRRIWKSLVSQNQAILSLSLCLAGSVKFSRPIFVPLSTRFKRGIVSAPVHWRDMSELPIHAAQSLRRAHIGLILGTNSGIQVLIIRSVCLSQLLSPYRLPHIYRLHQKRNGHRQSRLGKL